ncbi:MAG: putative Ig domain-containing protein [Acidobacteria bacterium]|nr:putative Ig domain-containing protein [Acidobacteriota bacterium]
MLLFLLLRFCYPKFDQRLLLPFALLVVAALCLRPLPQQVHSAAANNQTPLRGAAALAQLKQAGAYDSLRKSLLDARYRATPLPHTPLPLFDHAPLGAFAVQNPAQALRAYFTAGGAMQLLPAQDASWRMGLQLRGVQVGGAWLPVTAAQPTAQNNRVEIQKTVGTSNQTPLIEWYVNAPAGLEQGFTLQVRPVPNTAAPVRLVLAVGGDLQPMLTAGAQAVSFAANNGSEVLRYDKLASVDATGRALPSRMEVRGQELSLVVDDAQAVYPITIDPTFTQVKQLSASDGAADDTFGAAVAVNGDTAVVGAIYATVGGNSFQGAAYIFQRDVGGANNWGEVIKLEDPAGQADDNFGAAVAISGDIVAVGALSGDSVANADNEGAVYLYGRNQGGTDNWGLIKKVSASNGSSGDSFGWSVALSGNRLAVGANFINSSRGAVYLFEQDYDPSNPGTPLTNNWGERKILTAGNAANNDQFGYAVALSNETLIVGAYLGDAATFTDNKGAAYLYQRNQGGADNWGEVKRIAASDGALNDHFGAAVALHNDTAVVGAPDDDDGGNSSGSAYVFLRNQGGANNWGQIKKLTAGDAALNDQFGFAVAVDGDIAIIGAYADNVGLNTDQGSAYAFMRDYDPNNPGTPLTNNWGQFKKVVASDGDVGDQFGYAVAFQGETLLVGSLYDDVTDTDQGSAYVYKFLSTCPAITVSPTSLPNGSVGTAYSQTITASGGGGTYAFSVSAGSLPNGLMLNANTGLLSGTPTAINTFNFTISATDTASDCVGSRAYSVTINGPTWTGAVSSDWHTAGNWSNNAVPASGADVTLPASGVTNEVSISTGDVTVNNLTLNTGRTLNLTNNHTLTINGTLTLTGGNLTAATGSLIAFGSGANASRTSGHLIGSVKKTIAGTGSFTYHTGTANGYSPVAVTINGGTGDLTITAFQTSMPGLAAPTLALNRYWNLTSTLVSPDLNLGFTYLASDIPVTATESLFRILKDTNGSAPITLPGGSTDNVDETTHIAAISNVTSFSNWSAGQPDAPLAVHLAALNAYANKSFSKASSGVTVAWQTGFEADHLGFNVYREDGGQRLKINPTLIAGSALLAGERTPLTAGNSYTWTDARGAASVAYWLEEIDLRGNSTWHGPVIATGNVANPETYPSQLRTKLLSELSDATNPTQQSEWAETPAEYANQGGAESLPLSALMAASDPKSTPWTLPNQTAMKLAVRKTGWYRVTQAELTAAGFNTNGNPLLLQLYADGVEVPMRVFGKGAFGFESLEFFGRGLELPATDTRIYWLTFGNGPGLRLETVTSRIPDQFTSSSFRSTVERKDRIIYFSGLLNGEAENWFGPVISATGALQTLTTRFVERNASATLELALQGVTDQTHAVNIEVNGRYLATMNFTGKAHPVQRFDVPGAWLLEGENEIKLLSAAGASDVNLVDAVRLTYARAYRADNDALSFSLSAGQSAFISGFSTPSLRLLKLNGNGAEREITVKAQLVNGSYGFALLGEGATYLALGDNRPERVAALTRNQPSNWRAASNAADFIIITSREFWNSANKLANARRQNGLRVAVIDVEDVYDEFAYGAHTPQALKDLLTCAGKNWARKPAYALLLGDASSDPRDYLGLGNADFVPTWLGATTYFETGLENWLADINNDGVPELALGRLPVRTAAQAEAVINKILAFKSSTAPRNALLVSDRTVDGYDYKRLSNQLAALLPASWTKQQVNRTDGTPDAVRQGIVQFINNQTPLVVNWFGHGSTQVWTGDGLLRTQDAATLTNNAAGLFVMATCLNGYFIDPQQTSLGEAVLTNASGGAFAVVSSSALNQPAAQLVFAQTFYRSLFNSGLTLGQAMTAARVAAIDRDVRNSYVLFGDPTMQLFPVKNK